MEQLAEGSVWKLPLANSQPGVRWFWPRGNVVDRDGVTQVYIGGALLGWFDPSARDRGRRNVLLVTLAKEPTLVDGARDPARSALAQSVELLGLQVAQDLCDVGAVTGCVRDSHRRRVDRISFETRKNRVLVAARQRAVDLLIDRPLLGVQGADANYVIRASIVPDVFRGGCLPGKRGPLPSRWLLCTGQRAALTGIWW